MRGALAAIPSEEAHQKWVEGLELIDRKFKDILKNRGSLQIQALGMEFDCRTMEAVTSVKGKKIL